ncbi:MAG: metal-dependent hydrolase [Nitrospirota bacterium]
MASAFTHVFVAAALGKAVSQEKMPLRFWMLGLFCTLLPDLDVIAFRLGIPYRHMFGHRGFFHSLPFALIVGVLVVSLAFRTVPRYSNKWWLLAGYFFAVTASHGVLDAMTSGGYGIAFFSPFDDTRYFLPWRPLVVSPIGVYGFFSRWGWNVIVSEFLWIWLPILMLLFILMFFRKKLRRRPPIVP